MIKHLNSSFSSVQFSLSVVSNSLQPHGLQQAKPSCQSPTPRVYSNSCPLSWRCHPAISSSVIPFSYCPQSFPVSGSFPMSQLFAWGGQSTGASALASFLPKKSQGWSGLENFEHYFTSVWDECNCAAVWAFFGIGFLWDWNENWISYSK